MTFWELLSAALASAGLFASVLGAFLTYAARKNGEATRELIRSMEARTIELFQRMDQRADEQHREVAEIFERIDIRGNERHREAIEAISALKAR